LRTPASSSVGDQSPSGTLVVEYRSATYAGIARLA
jgi:hypothetical protein